MRRRGAVAGAPTAPAAHADANLGPIVRARDKDGRVWPRNPHQLSAGDGGGRRRRRLITTYSSAPRAPVPEWPRDAAAAAAAAARRRVSFFFFFFRVPDGSSRPPAADFPRRRFHGVRSTVDDPRRGVGPAPPIISTESADPLPALLMTAMTHTSVHPCGFVEFPSF